MHLARSPRNSQPLSRSMFFHLPLHGCFSVHYCKGEYSNLSKMQARVPISSEDLKSTPMLDKPIFKPLCPHEMSDGEVQSRKIPVPSHRMNPLKHAWYNEDNKTESIHHQVYNVMKIDIRMNLKTRKVELKTRSDTPDISHLRKCADFVQAFVLGFDVKDGIALLRMDEVFVDSFEIKDMKTLRGEHLSRTIGRLCGKGGRTKFAIENTTTTRIVIADTKIHILGAFVNIKVARDALCQLIMGSPAGKIYSKLRAVSSRLAEMQ